MLQEEGPSEDVKGRTGLELVLPLFHEPAAGKRRRLRVEKQVFPGLCKVGCANSQHIQLFHLFADGAEAPWRNAVIGIDKPDILSLGLG